jgi:hypothetical protein
MSDEIRDANLELLIGLKQHLDQAAALRALLDRLLNLAGQQSCVAKAPRHAIANRERRADAK